MKSQNASFHMIGHSMGGVVNYMASKLKQFPIEKLKTMDSLASPIGEQSPQ